MQLPPRIYHLAETANLAAIQRDGLLPASALIARAGLTVAEAERLERAQRLARITLPDGTEIRDQRPLPSSALAGCLVGMAPEAWYALINAWVFFWLNPERLNRQRAACGPRPQVVLTVGATTLADVGRATLQGPGRILQAMWAAARQPLSGSLLVVMFVQQAIFAWWRRSSQRRRLPA